VSGDACDSWNRYEQDLDLIVELGLNSYRLSVEWARIEPERGVIDAEALAHYRRMLEACRARDILPVVTLHHFTLPLWVADVGVSRTRRLRLSWHTTHESSVSHSAT